MKHLRLYLKSTSILYYTPKRLILGLRLNFLIFSFFFFCILSLKIFLTSSWSCEVYYFMMNHLDCDQTKFDYELSCSSVYRVNQNKLITILKVIDFAEVGKYCGSYCRRSK